MPLYFVVKMDAGYEVWETTATEMYERTLADPTLEARLQHHPFETRAEAERRIKELFANPAQPNAAGAGS